MGAAADRAAGLDHRDSGHARSGVGMRDIDNVDCQQAENKYDARSSLHGVPIVGLGDHHLVILAVPLQTQSR